MIKKLWKYNSGLQSWPGLFIASQFAQGTEAKKLHLVLVQVELEFKKYDFKYPTTLQNS